jgi:hypothetical protein
MARAQAAAGAGVDGDAVVAVFIDQDLRDAAALARDLLDVAGLYAFLMPERHAHAAEVVVADAGEQRHAGTLARGGHRGIAALAALG